MIATLHPAGDRPVTPWKNGKGVTREIAVFPPGATIDSFEWRLSIADVREGGPFSNFPGIDRRLAVLDGTIILDIGGEAAIALDPGSDPIAFPGDIPCRAEIPDGAVRDLNVMTRRGRFSSDMMRVQTDGPIPLAANASTVILVALCDLTVRIGETAMVLKSLDAARLDAPGESLLLCDRSSTGPKDLYLISLFRDRIAGRGEIFES